MGMCFCQTGPYKEHFVCFHCRKMFKKPSFAEIQPSQGPATYAEYLPQCPECGQPMHNMGKEFETTKADRSEGMARHRAAASRDSAGVDDVAAVLGVARETWITWRCTEPDTPRAVNGG